MQKRLVLKITHICIDTLLKMGQYVDFFFIIIFFKARKL